MGPESGSRDRNVPMSDAAPASRHRSRRHQDRDHRARRGRPRAAAAPGCHAARRLSRDARRDRAAGRGERSASSVPAAPSASARPGSISRATGLLRGSNSVCLNGQPIRRDLEAMLGREVRITNDANCFALSEATDGAGRGRRCRPRRHSRHRSGIRRGRARQGARRAQRHRRRVGPQPAARGPATTSGRDRVLLRPVGLHRNVALRTGPRAGPSARRPARPSPRRRSPPAPPAATPRAKRPSRATKSGSPARSRT